MEALREKIKRVKWGNSKEEKGRMLQSRMLFWKMELFGGRGGDTARDGENSEMRKEGCVRVNIRRGRCGGI